MESSEVAISLDLSPAPPLAPPPSYDAAGGSGSSVAAGGHGGKGDKNERTAEGGGWHDIELIECIGHGSFGAVYRAERRGGSGQQPARGSGGEAARGGQEARGSSGGQEEEPVAVKLVSIDGPEKAAVMREVRMLRTCAHPNVVAYHDAFERTHALRRALWVVMELCAEGRYAIACETEDRV